jgi:hypothetical protein
MFLRQGYGVEDIAVMLKEDVDAIRREVAILREEGELAGLCKVGLQTLCKTALPRRNDML